ncbi:uncharacterized protein RSE6_06114 [Rhynchosporium secalis]|uniref:Uncharacterized protein n=1 Tax=Rhynchosporium secalis TaxID=38038 RepID=A0A1E1M9I9_RHYSE|nr:uncharacterized protein RSE6_06114 [Rhynchosporium secalis]
MAHSREAIMVSSSSRLSPILTYPSERAPMSTDEVKPQKYYGTNTGVTPLKAGTDSKPDQGQEQQQVMVKRTQSAATPSTKVDTFRTLLHSVSQIGLLVGMPLEWSRINLHSSPIHYHYPLKSKDAAAAAAAASHADLASSSDDGWMVQVSDGLPAYTCIQYEPCMLHTCMLCMHAGGVRGMPGQARPGQDRTGQDRTAAQDKTRYPEVASPVQGTSLDL